MRDCQIEAIKDLEESFAENRPRALIQMATGAGKTFTACAFTYRLIKYAEARRVLFLVDRSNLGDRPPANSSSYVTPDTGRKFTELYNVQHLTSHAHRSRLPRHHLHHPAPLLDAARRRTRRRRRRTCPARTRAPRTARAPRTSPTIPPSRSRPSTSSSPTNATAPSTTSGGRCSNTSTPFSSASPPRRQSRPSASSTRTSSRNTTTSAPSPTASMSATTSIASKRKVTEAGRQGRERFLRRPAQQGIPRKRWEAA